MQPETLSVSVSDQAQNCIAPSRVPPQLKPFQKGHDPRRNLGGRPKKLPITEALARALTPKQAKKIAQRFIAEAIEKGSVPHAEFIADRVEGPVQREASDAKTMLQVVVITGDA